MKPFEMDSAKNEAINEASSSVISINLIVFKEDNGISYLQNATLNLQPIL